MTTSPRDALGCLFDPPKTNPMFLGVKWGAVKFEGGSKTNQTIEHGYFSTPRGGLETIHFELFEQFGINIEKSQNKLRKRAHLIE